MVTVQVYRPPSDVLKCIKSSCILEPIKTFPEVLSSLVHTMLGCTAKYGTNITEQMRDKACPTVEEPLEYMVTCGLGRAV